MNRSYNAFNLLVGTGEQSINNLSGALVSQPAFNQTLLTGSDLQVFNSGQFGGLVGSFDQTLAARATTSSGCSPASDRRPSGANFSAPETKYLGSFSGYTQIRYCK